MGGPSIETLFDLSLSSFDRFLPLDELEPSTDGLSEYLLIGSPGRNELSTMEAPEPFATVAQFPASDSSRPGPVCEEGNGALQPVQSGKFSSSSPAAFSDRFSNFRTRPVHHQNTPQHSFNSPSGLRLYYQNVRGLKSKIAECFVATSELGYEIYAFTETWLNSSVPSSQLFCSDYNVFRCDRSNANSRRSRGGGVLIAVSTKLSSSIENLNIDSIENLWVKISYDNSSFLIGTAYVPPEKSHDGSVIDLHVDALSAARLRHSACNVILLGDFNQSQLIWIPGQNNSKVLDPASVINTASASLLDGMTLNGVSQRNGIRNSQNRTLDLVFSDDSILISPIIEVSDVVVPIEGYHPPLEFEISFPCPIDFVENFDASARDFNRADFDTMNRILSGVDWSNILSCTDVDVAVDTLRAILDDAFENTVPLVRPPLRPPWTNANLKRLKKIRSKLLRKFSNSRLRQKQSELRRNPKKFWKFVNSKRKESGLPATLQLNNRIAKSPAEKCYLFATHFASVVSDKSPSASQSNAAVTRLPVDVLDLDVFAVSEEMVSEAIINLKNSTSAGQDGIPAGVTSLAACSKVFEKIVNNVMFSACRNWISENQHGFFPKRSVTSNLMVFTSFCISNMDDGKQIDAIYTDISAAFDSVNHDILLKKLHRLGFSERMCAWIRSYLTDRRLAVKIGSDLIPKSGVPQGSNLGPLLFTLFCNDINLLLTGCGVLLYADDLKIFLVINSQSDCLELQRFLDTVVNWCAINLLVLSVAKCCIITFGRRKNPFVYDYNVMGEQLHRVEEIKDLGVLLDSQMTFKRHYSKVLEKANRMLGFIIRLSKEFTDPVCLRALYCCLVRSILESANLVWWPFEAAWTARFEAIQRRFVRYALRELPWENPLNLPPYAQRCALLGLHTLSDRRSIGQSLPFRINESVFDRLLSVGPEQQNRPDPSNSSWCWNHRP
ncbi:uncharacterized protein LOC129753768 [Uranotaenia lowii]|uniref:uncharacterized protein LOC129753768 n=1 Tax=Uranotaenia lowii TaxID=190385 RepID=UPI00247ACB59|nr:uncharacterized protein LOC129753768 [Uranotaenia lowii]